MADNNSFQKEPSVEDILASIRRILSEDEKALNASPGEIPVESKSELKQISEQRLALMAGLASNLASNKKPLLNSAEIIANDVLELTNEMLVDEEKLKQIVDSSRQSLYPEEKPEGVIETELKMKEEPEGDGRLISPKTTAVSVAALDRLAHSARESDVALGNADVTLVSLVRDVLQPLLKAWLDEHLPCIIERIVTKEITYLIHRIK